MNCPCLNCSPPAQKLLGAGAGRPASIYFRGGIINIIAHDLFYLEKRKQFIQDLKAFHPDSRHLPHPGRLYTDLRKGSGRSTWNVIQKLFREFEREHRAWYKTFGLEPPRASLFKAPPKKKKLFKEHKNGEWRGGYVPPTDTILTRKYKAAAAAGNGAWA